MERHMCSRALPNTPRVSDKIIEYYEKFGQDRDLEKFMRIHSPASMQHGARTQESGLESCCPRQLRKSRDTISSTSSSCEALAMMPARPLSGCVLGKSMPNIDVHGNVAANRDVVVDINIELEEDNGKIFCASTENIQTPKKNPHGETKHTQTPESIAKTHRRLEWDSLGDIGYKKSMSTSNVSILERSLLKEFFKETSVTSEPSTSHKREIPSEAPQRNEQHENVERIKKAVVEHGTPPLACSTLVEGLSEKTITRGVRPKMISQSTSSTSLQKRFEKSAQTSLLKPANVNSQEIQVNMSSSNSVIEGTATPSSFEYYSSRSSKSRSSRTSVTLSSNASIPPAQHPFITSITELLKKRNGLSETSVEGRKNCDNIKELQSKFQAAFDENKENQKQSHSNSTVSSTSNSYLSLVRQAPELDLGIQLICSLIDAKSLNGKQKKKLIRDIVKRITRLNSDDDFEHTNVSSSQKSLASENQNTYDAVYSRRRNGSLAIGQPLMDNKIRTNIAADELGVSPIQMCAKTTSTTDDLANSQVRQTKDRDNTMQIKTNVTQQKVLGSSNQRSAVNTCTNKQFPQSKPANENRNIVPNVSSFVTQTHNRPKQSELNALEKNNSADVLELEETENHLHIIRKTRSTQTTKSSASADSKKLQLSARTTSSSIATTTSSSSHDLPTQKSLRKNKLDEQPTMREWLNPLTQSEIEYEEKKREQSEINPITIEAQKHTKNSKKSKHDSGRIQQLNWIDNEIQRLECLKNLLLKDDNEKSSITQSQSTTQTTSRFKDSNNSAQADKLYDTVCSDKSSVLSESAERLVKEIEIILEESSEDVINLKDNSKRCKEVKKETQIIYERPSEGQGLTEKCNKAKFRTMKETITINEEQLLSSNGLKKQQTIPSRQRQKIDTPTSDQALDDSESLRDMVKQRKREFIESYKNKKQHHYDALKQQQKEQSKFRYLPMKDMHISKGQGPPTYFLGSYSVPHSVNRNFSPTEYAYPQSNLPASPNEKDVESPTPIVYSTAASFNHIKVKQNKQSTSSATAEATTTTPSASSMFCISSDVSVPMGSNNGSSTPTTTHHYDDVAAAVAGVAVQTSHSVLGSQPNFGPQLHPYFHPKRIQTSRCIIQPKISNTTAIQVKPKGIAYVIEFDNKKVMENLDESEKNVNPVPTVSATISTAQNVDGIGKTSTEPHLTLQDHLEKAKPKFLQHTKERKAILNKLQAMRQARDRQLREIIDNTSFNSLERRLKYLPPPPIQKVRILKTKEMKALTNKRVASLPEVVARKEQEKEEKKRRGNRILRDVFNRRLQRRVRNGKLSLNHSKTVI